MNNNMSKLFFIYAYPEKYGGLHGMYRYELTECNDYQEACEDGCELAEEAVDSYLREDEIYSIYEYMNEYHNGEEWDECYREDYEDIFNEAREDAGSYEIFPLKDGVTEQDFHNWEKENREPRDFIRRYCRQVIEEDYE